MTGLQLVPQGLGNPEWCRTGAQPWGLSLGCGRRDESCSDREASWSELLHSCAHAEPPDIPPTLLAQEIPYWLDLGHVLLCIAPGNFPAPCATIHLHGPTRVQEAQQLGFWFSVTKAVVLGIFSTSECFICALNAFLRQRKIKKLRSKPEDVAILTQHNFTSLRTYTEEEEGQENLWTSSFSRSRSLKISLC